MKEKSSSNQLLIIYKKLVFAMIKDESLTIIMKKHKEVPT